MALTMLQTNWKTEQELKHNIGNQEYSWRFSRGIFLLLNFASLSKAESSMETEKAQHIFWQLCKMAMGANPENFRSAVPGLSGKNLEVPVPEQSCSTKIPFLQLREAGVLRITINKEPNSLRTWQPYPGFIQILHAQPCATALWFPTGIQDNTSSQQPGQLFPSCSGEHR